MEESRITIPGSATKIRVSGKLADAEEKRITKLQIGNLFPWLPFEWFPLLEYNLFVCVDLVPILRG